MNATLRQLEIFSKVVDLQSITKASEELYLSQPAVSMQLKKLQEQFEVPLTELVGRQLYVTDFGYEIAESARRILREVDQIRYKSESFQGRLAGRLKVSIVSTAKYVMPYFLSDFMAENPAVDLQMDVTNKRKVVRSLEDNKVDFSLVSVLPKHLDLERVELMSNRLFLVKSRSKVLREHDSLERVLADTPLLFREPGSATRDAMERFLSSTRLPTAKKIELTSNEATKQAILAGLGVSIMPLIGLKNEINGGELEIVPVEGLPLTTYWNLVWLKSKKLSPVAEAFLNYVREHKQDIIDHSFGWIDQYAKNT